MLRLLPVLLPKISESDRGREYDGIIGLSDGFDCSYIVRKVFQVRLWPLIELADDGCKSESP